ARGSVFARSPCSRRGSCRRPGNRGCSFRGRRSARPRSARSGSSRLSFHSAVQFRDVDAPSELSVSVRVHAVSFTVCPPEVRAAFFGQPLGLGPPPVGDLRVMARKENLGYRAALPDGGFRILRVFDQTFGKGLLL